MEEEGNYENEDSKSLSDKGKDDQQLSPVCVAPGTCKCTLELIFTPDPVEDIRLLLALLQLTYNLWIRIDDNFSLLSLFARLTAPKLLLNIFLSLLSPARKQ